MENLINQRKEVIIETAYINTHTSNRRKLDFDFKH